MLICTARFSKRKALTALLVLAVAAVMLILLFGGRRDKETAPDLPRTATNEERVAYLRSFGWEVEPEPLETLQFLLPEEMTEPYLAYNKLQLTQGFDLNNCRGKQVSRYTYAVTNYPGRPLGVQANLYVCEELPAAGDILCPGADGFQSALAFPEEGT